MIHFKDLGEAGLFLGLSCGCGCGSSKRDICGCGFRGYNRSEIFGSKRPDLFRRKLTDEGGRVDDNMGSSDSNATQGVCT